jgi:CheY-specific phosphatase CheX
MLKEYLMPFVKECKNMLIDFINIEETRIVIGRPYITEPGVIHQGDIATIIELSGDITGAVAISMNTSSALKLADIVTGSSHGEVNNEIMEVMSELVNIFTGQAKKHFEKIAALFISLPVTVVNGTFSKPFYSENRYIAIPFLLLENAELILSISISDGTF